METISRIKRTRITFLRVQVRTLTYNTGLLMFAVEAEKRTANSALSSRIHTIVFTREQERYNGPAEPCWISV